MDIPPWAIAVLMVIAGGVYLIVSGLFSKSGRAYEIEIREALADRQDERTLEVLTDLPDGEVDRPEVEPLPEPARSMVIRMLASADRDARNLRAQLRQARAEIENADRRHRLLREYATQSLSQSRVSFRASMIAGAIGFAVILVGVLLAISGSSWTQAAIPVIGGAVIDAVAALFFTQDRRHQQMMLEFFDKLREDRRLDEALVLINGISDDELRARVQSSLVLNFANVPDALDVLRASDRRTGEDKPESG